jgi:hypothetical protein
VVRLKVKHIDSAQNSGRAVQEPQGPQSRPRKKPKKEPERPAAGVTAPCLVPACWRSRMSSNTFRTCAAAMIAVVTASIITAYAQNAPPADESAPLAPSVRLPAAIAGSWSGTAIQVQRSIEYAVSLEVTVRGAQINYPGLNCGGNLRRIGASAEYVFYVETITRGPVHDDGLCSNGTITMARAGDKLAWAWFGLVKGAIATADGLLTRQGESAPADGQSITGSTAPSPLGLIPRRRARPKPAAPPAPPPL